MPRELDLSIECRLENLRVVAAAIREIAEPVLGVPAAQQLDVAVTEVVSNIIRHGHRQQPDAKFDVRIRPGDDRVVIELLDRGSEFTPAKEPVMPALDVPLELLPEGGFGMAIVSQTMDEFSRRRENGVNITRIVKVKAS